MYQYGQLNNVSSSETQDPYILLCNQKCEVQKVRNKSLALFLYISDRTVVPITAPIVLAHSLIYYNSKITEIDRKIDRLADNYRSLGMQFGTIAKEESEFKHFKESADAYKTAAEFFEKLSEMNKLTHDDRQLMNYYYRSAGYLYKNTRVFTVQDRLKNYNQAKPLDANLAQYCLFKAQQNSRSNTENEENINVNNPITSPNTPNFH